MPYIKLLTIIAGLALLTACGGGTAETPDTAGGNATDCKTNAFHADCNADAPAIKLRQDMCLADDSADSTCGVVITGACEANPFRTETACMADTYLPNRIAECITDGNAGEAKCETLLSDTDMNTALTDCLTNPFDVACESVTAFTTYALARTNRASFCDNSDNVADDLCTGDVVMPICGLDPFNAICFTDDTYLSPRITDCIMAGNAGEEKCDTLLSDTAMNTELTDCLENPFATACESVTAFTDFALARTNRLTFCNDNMNVANGLCTGANLMNVCVADPFNAICFADNTYLPARITNCITGGNAGDMKCETVLSDSTMNTELTDCLENPFATACESVSAFTTFALARTNRVTFCEIGGNESNALCMDTTLTNLCEFNPFSTACTGQPNTPNLRVASCLDANNMNKDPSCTEILLVNHADYLASFGDTPPPATVALAIANTDTQSHFLSVDEEDGIDKTELTGNLTDNTLRLGGVDTDTEDTNGVAYVLGVIEGTAQSFVGLLPTTNLGAPLPSTTADATWAGRYYHGANREIHDIDFNIDFGTGEIEATDIQGNITTKFDLDFTAEGVITGDVIINPDTEPDTAEARGLIGEQGLVGGFANTDDVGIWGANFFGGFVAVPPPPPPNACIALTTCVDTGDLETYPTKPNEVTVNGFLTAEDTGLNMIDIQINGAPARTIVTDPAPFTGRRGGADSTNPDGFAYFVTADDGSQTPVPISYAGILATTNLGAPLLSTTASAVWAGHFSVATATNIATNYYVDFTNGRFGFSNAGGDGFGTLDHANLNGTYTMNAHFGSHASANAYSAGRMGGTLAISSISSLLYPTIVGLIGEEGAVGVFTRVGQATRTVGGFTATNPAYTPPTN